MTIRKIKGLFIFSIMLCSGVWADDGLHTKSRRPFQIRNQFPLNLQFLSFTADNAFTMSRNDFRFGLNYSQANTFAQSPEALTNISRSEHRTELNHQFSTVNQNSNRFLIDSGSSRINLLFEYGLSDHITLGLDLSYMGYHGGFLDAPIEMVHQIAGFPYASRAMLKQNTSQIFLSGSENNLFLNSNEFSSSGFGDLVILAKGQIYKSVTHGLALATRVALKIPTGNYQQLRGSGSFDYGIDLTATKSLKNSFISTNISAIFPGKWKLMPDVNINPSFSWILSYEYLWGKRLSLTVQNQIQNSYFSQQLNEELSKTIFEWTAGLKYDIGRGFRLSFAVTENYIHHNNTADFGFHFGLSRGF